MTNLQELRLERKKLDRSCVCDLSKTSVRRYGPNSVPLYILCCILNIILIQYLVIVTRSAETKPDFIYFSFLGLFLSICIYAYYATVDCM
jgi:hypothetical protein